MNISEIKDLMAQFDASSLREFSYKTPDGELLFSKNEPQVMLEKSVNLVEEVSLEPSSEPTSLLEQNEEPEGELVTSPLVGVAYLAAAPDKPSFVAVGDQVKKGQTLLIIEAMKVMNEVPAPRDGVVTEILVGNEEMVDFGKGLVRIL